MFGPFKKEKPIMGLMGAGGGATGLAASGAGGPSPGMEASGGVIAEYTDPQDSAIYRAHTFTSSGSFVVSALSENPDCPNVIDYLIVAGGGGGGRDYYPGDRCAGGGGAGSVRYVPQGYTVTGPVTIPVTVGYGGKGGSPTGTPNSAVYVTGLTGEASTLTLPTGAVSTYGGGGGGGHAAPPTPGPWGPAGLDGGSGGGGRNGNPFPAPGTRGAALAATGHPGGINIASPPTAGWGNDGGTGSGTYHVVGNQTKTS